MSDMNRNFDLLRVIKDAIYFLSAIVITWTAFSLTKSTHLGDSRPMVRNKAKPFLSIFCLIVRFFS